MRTEAITEQERLHRRGTRFVFYASALYSIGGVHQGHSMERHEHPQWAEPADAAGGRGGRYWRDRLV